MDDIVKAALAKWPNVPACYGWLALDARGQWFLRDESVQRAGPFPEVKGSRIEHPKLLAFIERNYEADERGCWFFQNGPQRVYVELEAAPWIWRVDADANLTSHTGLAARVDSVWIDEDDRLYAIADLGLGIVHTLDMHAAAGAVESGCWQPRETRYDELVQRCGVVLKPAP